MKKILSICIAMIAGSIAANAGQAVSVNTMVVAVPEILSVTAVPGWQGITLTEAQLLSSTPMQDVVYTIKSNASYNVKTEYASTVQFTNNPSQTEKDASHAAFRSSMQFARSTNNQWYPLGQLEILSPFNENNNPHTTAAGTGYTYHSKMDNLGYNAAPGVYTVTLTVTATQP